LDNDRELLKALEKTWVVRTPKQHLATFGITNINYYVVTSPVYLDEFSEKPETVIRTGKVISERPSIITPTYALNLLGFSSDAYEYFQAIANKYGPNQSGILYQYRNESTKMEIVSGIPQDIASNISKDLDAKNDNMSVVMVGVDELWDVSLLKFIYELTTFSAASNISEFQGKGLLNPQPQFGGIPKAATEKIEKLFFEARNGGDKDILKDELDKWGVFRFYEDRFLSLYRA